uniref:Uncharacterized protein n=1 Tax=Anguilla anguilla TaxID=7936 RepID=A0A0E9WZI1_ANGAN
MSSFFNKFKQMAHKCSNSNIFFRVCLMLFHLIIRSSNWEFEKASPLAPFDFLFSRVLQWTVALSITF